MTSPLPQPNHFFWQSSTYFRRGRGAKVHRSPSPGQREAEFSPVPWNLTCSKHEAMLAVTRRIRVLALPAMVTSREPIVPVPESRECQWQTTWAKSQAPRVPPPESYECQCQTNRANSVPAAGFPPWSRGCSCRGASLYSIKEPFWWEPPRPPPLAPLSRYLRHASLRIHRSHIGAWKYDKKPPPRSSTENGGGCGRTGGYGRTLFMWNARLPLRKGIWD